MPAPTPETEAILHQRFGQDSVISLATTVNHIPFVRSVDAFYENGAFYILTHALSGKMQQISQNPDFQNDDQRHSGGFVGKHVHEGCSHGLYGQASDHRHDQASQK